MIRHPWRGGGYVGKRVKNPGFSVLAGQQGVRAEPLPHLWEDWAAVGSAVGAPHATGGGGMAAGTGMGPSGGVGWAKTGGSSEL